jgi:beta-mannosidase
VLLAGNNEDYQLAEASLGWDPSDTDPESWLTTTFPARYIYEKLLPDIVAIYAPGIFYHPGSPYGGGKPTRDPTVGDIHQWNGNSLN